MERVESQQTASRTRRGGILESASRRVRMIFSVMASPNRIDILRILNSKGPLTYSELKSLAGFKSKKESGKFAYHLRKLLRQSLVSLNKAERRYTITNLGKLVLSLARQIEERSIIESGKLYVRTTKPSIEEFDSNKIIQSLIRETNMPLELAHKITEEVENKIYKIQTSYLTSSLIRETTNSVLVDHGYDEYRSKLTRLGIPPSDLINLLHETNNSGSGIQDLLIRTSQFVFNEYLLNNSLPKDIVDLHLTGEINIEKSGLWNLLPDTVFIHVDSLESAISAIKGKCLTVSRISSTISYQNFDSVLPIILSQLSKEVSREIILDGLLNSIQKDLDSNFNLSEKFANFFYLSSAISSYTSYSPLITLSITIDDYEPPMITSVLNGYQKYITNTPTPTIGLSITYDNPSSIQTHSYKLADLSRTGGIISFSKQKIRGRYGLTKPTYASNTDTIITLQSLSVNLPRIAYQSNKDETYFRARLALLLKPLTSIIFQRYSKISDIIQKGTVPLLTNATSNMEVGKVEAMINLVGIHESVYRILGHNSGNSGDDVIHKVAQTTVDIVNEQIKGNQENTVIGITMLKDESAARFRDLNTDKYGKSQTHSNHKTNYSHDFRIQANDILSINSSVKSSLNVYSSIEKILTGGVSVDLDITTIPSIQETKNSIESSLQLLPFFHTTLDFYICNICGKRSYNTTINVCDYCSSHKISRSST